jgi:hypothetical protein
MGGPKTKKLEPRLKPRTGPPPRVPVGLSVESAAIWESETRSRSRSPGRLALLEQALRALDRAATLREQLEREGLTTVTKTTGAVHIHPLVKVEAAERMTFLKIAKMLRLEWDREADRI